MHPSKSVFWPEKVAEEERRSLEDCIPKSTRDSTKWTYKIFNIKKMATICWFRELFVRLGQGKDTTPVWTQILLTCPLSRWICGLRSWYKRFAKETGKYIRGEHFTVSLYCKMFSYISITYIVLLYQYHIYQDQYHLYSSPISVSPIYQYQYHYHLYQYQYHLYQYQYLKICVKLIFHYLRLHAITHTNLENVIANLVGNLPRRF